MNIAEITVTQAATMFRDWLNNFVTVRAFSGYYDITDDEATQVIAIGREAHNLGL